MLQGASPSAADYLTWDRVDAVFSRNPHRFEGIWEAAETRTVRIAMFGDSQETNPGGYGYVYAPRLNYEFFQHYGNSPETPIAPGRSFGETHPAMYLMLGRGFGSDSRLTRNQMLPNVTGRAHSTRNADDNINGQVHGQLTMLQHDAFNVVSSAGLDGAPYFKTSGSVRAEIFAATHAGSGEVTCYARPKDGPESSHFVPMTTRTRSALGLDSDQHAIRSFVTPPLAYNGREYMQVEIFGTDDDRLTDVVGVRFRNETDPHGVIVNSFSVGGYSTADVLEKHGDAGPMLKAFGPWDAIWLHTGANDAYGKPSTSAADYRENVEVLMRTIRGSAWLDDSTMPFILSTEPYVRGGSYSNNMSFDRYAGALKAIADSDPNTLVLNGRRLTEDLGWNVSGAYPFLAPDGVHHSAEGARLLAAVEVQALLSVPEPTFAAWLLLTAIATSRHGRPRRAAAAFAQR